jgi:cytidine deaminase
MSANAGNSFLDQLTDQARAASERAYSPYSGVRVGAAVRSAGGQVFIGCNVENASYGLTQCAERNALAAAIAAGVSPRSMSELVVYATGFEALSPCGACRQVMSELVAAEAVIHSVSADGRRCSWQLDQLFPAPFVLE